MNEQSKTVTNVIEVEFYPSIDDYVHITNRLAESVGPRSITVYFYYLFLSLNVIGFPAFLLVNNSVLPGVLIFVVNIFAVILLLPRVNTDYYRRWYEHVFGNREKELVRVKISVDGISYSADGADCFWSWELITSIEETQDSIYFFYVGNGFAVRKSGFPYHESSLRFIDTARQYLKSAHSKDLLT